MRLLIFFSAVLAAQTAPNIKDTTICANTRTGKPNLGPAGPGSGDMRKITINAPGAVCNDGTPAIMYVRAAAPGALEPDGPSANRWLIHFEGGGSCTTYEDCAERWCGVGYYTAHQMSSTYENNAIQRGGLLARNEINRLANRNVVMLNYCSSDQWQGRKSGTLFEHPTDPSKNYTLDFRGATIALAALDALDRGVEGMPRLTDATDILISGDSGGANGVRNHLDRIAARYPRIRVRGHLEATFDPDRNGRQGFPAGDPRDPVYPGKTASFNTVEVGMRNALLDDSCLAAHPTAPYLCADGSYLEANHITTPFVQFQDLADSNSISSFQEAGIAATTTQFSQTIHDQLAALPNIKNTAIERAAITTAPGVGGRLCGVHVMWSDDDGFLGRRYRTGPTATAYSHYEILWNWLTGATPTVVIEPRPPDTPTTPVFDSICTARMPSAPQPTIATVNSASYALNAAIAPESIVATFGANLAPRTVTADTLPLPTTLGGLQVNVVDSRGVSRLAPLYFVSPTQLLYLVPAGTAEGPAQINIGAQRHTVTIAATAPGIYAAAQNGRGTAAATYVRVTPQNVRAEGNLADGPIPVNPADQLYLILYGTGLRGGPASATVGGAAVPVNGPVAQGQYAGLDQINLGPLPPRVGYGLKEIVIRQGDSLANTVTVTLRAP